jgi:hypothetical protein
MRVPRVSPRAIVVAATLASLTPARAQNTASPTGAPEPSALALRDAIASAAAGNIQLLKQNIALHTSEGNVVAALGQFDLVLAADATFSRTVNPPLSAYDQSQGSSKSFVSDL